MLRTIQINYIHKLIQHLWEYKKKHIFSLQRSLPSSQGPQGTHLFGERCITNLEEKCLEGMWGMFSNMWEWLNIYIMTHIYDICCPSEVYTLTFWHILLGCKALIGNLTSPPWDDCIFAYMTGWIQLMLMVNVGKYTSPMNPTGWLWLNCINGSNFQRIAFKIHCSELCNFGHGAHGKDQKEKVLSLSSMSMWNISRRVPVFAVEKTSPSNPPWHFRQFPQKRSILGCSDDPWSHWENGGGPLGWGPLAVLTPIGAL